MFVWKDVLEAYTPGLACVIAESLDEALKIVQDLATSGKPWGHEPDFTWQLLMREIFSLPKYDFGESLGYTNEDYAKREKLTQAYSGWLKSLDITALKLLKEPKIIEYGGAAVSGGG